MVLMKKTVSAQEARNNLGSLLNMVYYQDAEIIIQRGSLPMAKIVPLDSKKEKKRTIKELAGGFQFGEKHTSPEALNKIAEQQYEEILP